MATFQKNMVIDSLYQASDLTGSAALTASDEMLQVHLQFRVLGTPGAGTGIQLRLSNGGAVILEIAFLYNGTKWQSSFVSEAPFSSNTTPLVNIPPGTTYQVINTAGTSNLKMDVFGTKFKNYQN